MFQRITGRDVLLILIAFFGITIAVNVAMATFAVRTFSGEDAPRSYMIGLHYNEMLAARAAQRTIDWSADLTAARMADGSVIIAVDLRDDRAKAVTGLALEGVLRLPATSREDHALTFGEVAPGRYEAHIATLHPAYWDLIVTTAGSDRRPFEARNRIWIR